MSFRRDFILQTPSDSDGSETKLMGQGSLVESILLSDTGDNPAWVRRRHRGSLLAGHSSVLGLILRRGRSYVVPSDAREHLRPPVGGLR